MPCAGSGDTVIRYVLAVVLATTIVGMSVTALDEASTIRGEQAVESEIEAVERAATGLVEAESVPPDEATPRRVVELDVPTGSLAQDGTEILRFEPVSHANATRVTYKVGDGPEQRTVIGVTIRSADGGAFDLSEDRGKQRIVLGLVGDKEGNPLVEIGAFGEVGF